MASEHPRSEERRDQMRGALQVVLYVALGTVLAALTPLVLSTIPI